MLAVRERRRSSRLHSQSEEVSVTLLEPTAKEETLQDVSVKPPSSPILRRRGRPPKRKLFDAEQRQLSPEKVRKRRRGRPRLSTVCISLTNDGLPITSLLCQFCTGDEDENRKGEPEVLLRCSGCHESAHPSCLSMSEELTRAAQQYDWQCFSCKTCQHCGSRTQTKHMLFCDSCDRGYHTFCLKPALDSTPEGEWNCPLCTKPTKMDVDTTAGKVDADEVKMDSSGTEVVEHEKDTEATLADTETPKSESRRSSRRRRSTVIVRRQKRTADRKEATAEKQTGGDDTKVSAGRDNADRKPSPLHRAANSEQLTELREQLSGLVPTGELAHFLEAYSAAQEQTCREQSDFVGKREEEDLVSSSRTPRSVCIDKNEMETRFASPYPEEFAALSRLFLCSFCLLPTSSPFMLRRHMAKCQAHHPPGCEIYRKDRIAVFEVDGAKSKDYCQRLCLLAKLFLHHKTLYHQVEPFLFYVLTEIERNGCQLVGYFSKEKESEKSYNLSCISVLPPFMRKGYGRILIDLSYALSRREGKIGSPERPLSDLGLVSYRAYWKSIILDYLEHLLPGQRTISIKSLSQRTSITTSDIISTLQSMGRLKYWRGDHIVLLDGHSFAHKPSSRPLCSIDEKALHWKPWL